jgi:hypothetical protein
VADVIRDRCVALQLVSLVKNKRIYKPSTRQKKLVFEVNAVTKRPLQDNKR